MRLEERENPTWGPLPTMWFLPPPPTPLATPPTYAEVTERWSGEATARRRLLALWLAFLIALLRFGVVPLVEAFTEGCGTVDASQAACSDEIGSELSAGSPQ